MSVTSWMPAVNNAATPAHARHPSLLMRIQYAKLLQYFACKRLLGWRFRYRIRGVGGWSDEWWFFVTAFLSARRLPAQWRVILRNISAFIAPSCVSEGMGCFIMEFCGGGLSKLRFDALHFRTRAKRCKYVGYKFLYCIIYCDVYGNSRRLLRNRNVFEQPELPYILNLISGNFEIWHNYTGRTRNSDHPRTIHKTHKHDVKCTDSKLAIYIVV